MKKYFYRISLLLVLSLFVKMMKADAQVDSLRIKLDNVFEHTDKSQIPTGFLEGYGAQFVNLNRLNGLLTDSNDVSALGWQYIYATVYSSKIHGVNSPPTAEANYTTFNNETKANEGANPVSMLALSYNDPLP